MPRRYTLRMDRSLSTAHAWLQPAVRAPLRFGRFELRPVERTLLDDGEPVALGARAFDLLLALVERPGDLLTKDELLATVWSGLVVEENNLQVQVSALRKILGQGALATIPGRGYRFNLPIEETKLAGDAVTGASNGTDAPSMASAAPSNLPHRIARLYGRDEDLRTIEDLLRRHAVVTITGAGGIGKTRVAQAVARRMTSDRARDLADGVWWVELAALADPALVASTVAQAMGMRLGSDRDTGDALRSHLAGRRALIVLDNCEHLADAVSALIDGVTAHAPGIKVLVTSQETLKSVDEHIYRLGALAVPATLDTEDALQSGAVALFVARAQAVDPRFLPTPANLPAVIEICRRLDGIPLAIELAAARLPLLGLEGLRTRLDERFNLLTGGARTVLRRHQTLRATLEWSHGLLTEDEQTVFQRLAVFNGGFTLESAQHVASDDRIDAWTVLDHLGALVDKSLVLAEGDPIPRYRMLETTRTYALERLAESGSLQPTLRRHAEAVYALLKHFEDDDWNWRATSDTVPEARAEVDNLRAALDWADSTSDGSALAVGLVGVSYCTWWSSFNLAEGLVRSLAMRRHLDAAESPQAQARFWLAIGRLALYSFRREGYDAAVRAAALYRELGDERHCFDALIFASVQGTRFASASEQEALIAQAQRLERSDWPARVRASVHFAQCWYFARKGEPESALACAHRQAEVCRSGGAEVGALYAVSNVSFMELLLGRFDGALQHARAAIARLHELGRDRGAGHLYHNVMVSLQMLGDVDGAAAAARDAYPRLAPEGDEYRMLVSLALLAAMQGRAEVAARICGFAEAMQARIGENANMLTPLLAERIEPLLAAALTPEQRSRLASEGASMRDDEVFRIALDADPAHRS